jgi:hypothetical protein
VWTLKRSQAYGSKHIEEKTLAVAKATLSDDGKTVQLEIPDLAPTMGMEIRCTLKGTDGRPVSALIHNTIHTMGR